VAATMAPNMIRGRGRLGSIDHFEHRFPGRTDAACFRGDRAWMVLALAPESPIGGGLG
jgi:hypothetical protein